MKLRILILFSFIILMFLNACRQDETAGKTHCENPDKALNPNGDSELAILMRELTAVTEQHAALLRENKALTPYPDEFYDLLIAKPTDSLIEKSVFDGHARAFLIAMKAVNNSNESNRIEMHNNLVQSCRSCHETFCRGPLKRIDKMQI